MSSDQLHVGFLLTSLGGGGAERNTLRLAAALIARGHRADLAIPRFAGGYAAAIPGGMRVWRARIPGADREFLRAAQRSGADVEAMTVSPFGVARTWLALGRKGFDLPVRTRFGVYAFATMIAKYVREARPQVLVSALPGADAAAVCAAEVTDRAVPVVVTVRNNVAADYAPEWLAAARTLYPLADAVVAVSRGVAESARRSFGLDAGRVRTIYNGVPAGRIRRLAHAEVAHPWFADGGPPVIFERRARGAAEGPPHPGVGVRAGEPRGARATRHPRQALGALPDKAQVPGAGPWRGGRTSASWTSTRTRTATCGGRGWSRSRRVGRVCRG